MTRFRLFAFALTLSGCGMVQGIMPGQVTAPQPTPAVLSPKERLVAAIASNGCLLTASNVATVLSQAGITQDQLRAFTPELAAEGRAEVSGEGTIRVLTATCI